MDSGSTTTASTLPRVIIVGGGSTGVELAGAIAELARQTLANEFRRFDPASLKLILVEAGPRILPAFAESLAAAATAKLSKLGWKSAPGPRWRRWTRKGSSCGENGSGPGTCSGRLG